MAADRDGHAERMKDLLRVCPGTTFNLASVDPATTPGVPEGHASKSWAHTQLAGLGPLLAEQQEKLYASAKVGGDRRRLLVVLQAMDCGGKDGTVHHVIGQLNPQGLRLHSFGVPTEEERRHPFLWRVRRALPEPGYVGVFNRSHYEDVLVARVHELVPQRIWQQRYDQINEFERELAADGVTLLKIMLHISKKEQAKRLRKRLDSPNKRWKFDTTDIDERARWDDYQRAYNDALTRCASDAAPWYVVPADQKWYRDWAVGHLLIDTFAAMNLRYPEPTFDLEVERARLAASS